jgi:hypothetical protein
MQNQKRGSWSRDTSENISCHTGTRAKTRNLLPTQNHRMMLMELLLPLFLQAQARTILARSSAQMQGRNTAVT